MYMADVLFTDPNLNDNILEVAGSTQEIALANAYKLADAVSENSEYVAQSITLYERDPSKMVAHSGWRLIKKVEL